MFHQLSLDEFKRAAKGQKRAAVFREFPCDNITPVHAFLTLKQGRGGVLLESAIKDQDMGRYSLIAFDPFAEFSSKGQESMVDVSGQKTVETSSPFTALKNAIHTLKISSEIAYPPLVGGAIGFATYDAVRLFEEIPDRHPDPYQIPDLFFQFHQLHVAFDHLKGTMLISVIVDTTDDVEKAYANGQEKIDHVLNELKKPLPQVKKEVLPAPVFHEEMTDEQFSEKIKKAHQHIRQGDAFQIVISRTFSCPYSADPFDLYRAMRMTNPSPFMFYLETPQFALAGSSPERLLRVQDRVLQTVPIAGTRPRIQGKEAEAVKELLEDEKEEAEHIMLVDLGRNDLGIVAKVGSLSVKELKTVRYFPHVIHLVSVIEAILDDKYDALDAFKAVFPAGTLTGAPKIRAMEIIDDLEESRRGIYGGAICTIDSRGNFDSCIVIRTAFIQNGVVSVRAGAGVVLDSCAKSEADETRAKAKGVLDAIKLVCEGIL